MNCLTASFRAGITSLANSSIERMAFSGVNGDPNPRKYGDVVKLAELVSIFFGAVEFGFRVQG